MKLTSNPTSGNNDIVITEKLPNTAKISSGLSIDINKAKLEDLILIKGIGPVTAKKSTLELLRDKFARH